MAIAADGVVNVLDGQAGPLLRILGRPLWVEAIVFKKSWDGHHPGHNKGDHQHG
jgi:hypothetical protein